MLCFTGVHLILPSQMPLHVSPYGHSQTQDSFFNAGRPACLLVRRGYVMRAGKQELWLKARIKWKPLKKHSPQRHRCHVDAGPRHAELVEASDSKGLLPLLSAATHQAPDVRLYLHGEGCCIHSALPFEWERRPTVWLLFLRLGRKRLSTQAI